MSKAMEKGLVPDLRFPEFRSAERWKQKELYQICEINPSINTVPETFIYIDLESVEEGQLLHKKIVSRKDAPSRAQRLLKKGDVIFQMVRPYQQNNYFFLPGDDLNYVASTGYAQLRAYESNAYLFQYLHNDGFVDRVLEKCTGSNYPAINSSDLSKILVEVPEPKEQQKIADCLSSIDALITAQMQKLDALKAHKKGMMQQLFPASGETTPKSRFPEFRDAEEWVETTIGNIGSFYYGKSVPKWSLEENALTPCVRYGELYTKLGASITEIYSKTNIDPQKLRFSKGREILIPRVGEKPEDFGKNCSYLKVKNIAIGEMISVFETPQNPLFYTYYFRSMYKQFAKVVEGQNVKNLYYAELEPLPIYQPPTEEQQKIADCLSSIDALITAQSQKLDALKAHKRGLMQQLFPSPESHAEVGS
jgi:type I restriction enzyme S subunit